MLGAYIYVFFHELGHALAAKTCGLHSYIRIGEQSTIFIRYKLNMININIGFPPIIGSTKHTYTYNKVKQIFILASGSIIGLISIPICLLLYSYIKPSHFILYIHWYLQINRFLAGILPSLGSGVFHQLGLLFSTNIKIADGTIIHKLLFIQEKPYFVILNIIINWICCIILIYNYFYSLQYDFIISSFFSIK